LEIPVLTRFINGLKLFFESKRMKWFTLIFFIGASLTIAWERIGFTWAFLAPFGLIFSVFPMYFFLLAIVSLVGKQKFLADEETYRRSVFLTVIWFIVSAVVLILMLIFIAPLFALLYFWIAFIGWILFQSYYSSRTALTYAQAIDIDHRSKLSTFLFGVGNIFNYVIVLVAAIGTVIFINPGIVATPFAVGVAIVGAFIALGFNFLNGLIIAWTRNKPYAENVAILGTFVSLYSAYFLYNVLKGFDPSVDLVSIGISVFFILYTMSSVGQTLSARADLDTRFKLSKELAATFTFFLASGYVFTDTFLSFVMEDVGLAGATGDAIKLIIFPLVALVMELVFLFRVRKVQEKAETPEDIPVRHEEEAVTEEVEEPEVEEIEEPSAEFEEEPEESTAEEDSESYESDDYDDEEYGADDEEEDEY